MGKVGEEEEERKMEMKGNEKGIVQRKARGRMEEGMAGYPLIRMLITATGFQGSSPANTPVFERLADCLTEGLRGCMVRWMRCIGKIYEYMDYK